MNSFTARAQLPQGNRYLLGLMHRGDGKAAKALAKKLLAWCPFDNLGVRMLMGDISLMTGDSKSAMKSFLKEAATSPSHCEPECFLHSVFNQLEVILRHGSNAIEYSGRLVDRGHLITHCH